ncbi:hypothetical protein HN51_002876 [Arachis hypogaea]|uniref:Pollen Ole e 1 allergen and extensin family protein n=1 Tax=Arachis hypogaea TaxID=3818 RepID=A0A445EKU3_ARAHY|nr:uncharacterized protein LOC112706431 [Arachis hypogaea]QHO51129.1 uncharacterized protein DS421_1g28280 [Arachis hypogaea]RYR76079.1 hypothetical protein Ahy_A01g000672 [Arachis hypogaea]
MSCCIDIILRCCCHTLISMLILFLFMVGSSNGEDINNNPLFEFSSRDEVVQMNGYGEEKLSTVLITGSLNCQPTIPDQYQPHAWPIPGASVAVNCHSNGRKRRGRTAAVAVGVTDEFGDFMVELPSYLHAIPNLEKICRVKINEIPKGSMCGVMNKRQKKKQQLSLTSFGNGIRTYSAGDIRLHHAPFKHSN